MSSTPSARKPKIRPGLVGLVVAIIVIVIAAFNVKVVGLDEVAAADAAQQFDPAAYAEEHYSTDIAPAVEADAIDLATLLADLEGGADEADFGNTSGASSAFAFPVTFTGVAGDLTAPVLPVTVDGVPKGTTVQVQVGPAVSGTALRDVTGTVDFNDFTNQLEYQNVANELNNMVKTEVLADFDAAAASGKTITVTGAFLRVNPALVSVVPVSIEVAP
jgi:predicted lipoprotein